MALIACAALGEGVAIAQGTQQWIALELYVRGDQDSDMRTWVEEAVAEREGLKVRVYDVSEEGGAGRERHDKICSYFRVRPEESLPMVYGCAQRFVAPSSRQEVEKELDQLRTMTVYVRSGCPRCARTKEYLKSTMPKYPGFRLVYRDVVTDRTAQNELNAVARKYNKSAVSVPVFHFCDQVTVGWDSPSGTGRRLEGLLERWTFERKPESDDDQTRLDDERGHRDDETSQVAQHVVEWLNAAPRAAQGRPGVLASSSFAPAAHSLLTFLQSEHRPRDPPAEDVSDENPEVPDDFELPLPGPPLPADVESEFELPLPADVDEASPDPSPAETYPPEDEVNLPVFGRIRASDLGLPAFTIAIGLVDGFNPCAMWVLLFLLSILVNLKSRWKIIAVAGTFVLISGLVYFAFMAAWLNALALLGQERPIQIVLGTLALLIGAVHVKDFFAFKKGISLSIPESAKPGIYAHVRRIVTAENIMGAVIGASTLAVLVNLLELLCTAGLPALYTDVLRRNNLPAWKEYAYLGLYNLAYMFDDALMVTIVTVTLGRNKLQEKQGRWLKLISGLIILALGVVMIFKPELLQFV